MFILSLLFIYVCLPLSNLKHIRYIWVSISVMYLINLDILLVLYKPITDEFGPCHNVQRS